MKSIKLGAIINLFLRQLGFEFRRFHKNHTLIETKEMDKLIKSSLDFDLIKSIHKLELEKTLEFLTKSPSQLNQDLFVLNCLNYKKNGFFVEFGATNGINLSNTYSLEKFYGWKGILAEPAKCWHRELNVNRSAFIEKLCVWSESNKKLIFNETIDPELSTINNFSDGDLHSSNRKKSKTYEVETITLNDLLDKYNAPFEIDYLSIDTEGSEFQILSSFNFKKYSFNVITIEHNYTADRENIYNLLTSNGYLRINEDLSRFDDWYINSALSEK